MRMGLRPWDPPMIGFGETGTHCARCGGDAGTSLRSLNVPVSAVAGITQAFPGLSERLEEVTGGVLPVVHTDPAECITGRPAYDAHTRLMLQFGDEAGRPFPRGGPIAVRVMCPRQGRNPHAVGRVYRLPEGLLLLARYWFGTPTVRIGDELVRTVGDDRVTPVLLTEVVTELWTGAVSMLCPCRFHLPVTPQLVARLELAARDTRPSTVVAPAAARLD